MPDNSYWQERQEQKYLIAEKEIDAYYEGLKRSFEQAKKEIHSIIADFYMRYADENGLTFTEAQKALSKAEIGSLKAFIAKVNRHMGEYNQELNNMSIKARMSPYQATEMQIDAILQELYTIEYKIKGEETFKEIYEDSYYRTWFNIDQYHGFHQEFAQVASSVVEELVKYPFNGANFSSRLWKQKDHMLQRLNESLTTMLVQGKNPKTLSDSFSKAFGTKEFEAYRLLHTEGSFMSEQGTLAAYKEDEVQKYQFLATLDIKTSDICEDADGEVYEVEKAVVGVNYPPLHNFCRSTTKPYYEDGIGGTRAARDPKTGKTYKVPADMDYKDWHTEYIAGNPEVVIAEQKWKNRYTDKKQYEKYKEILGADAPKTFDSFQNLKYTDSESWPLTKLDYRRRVQLRANPDLTLPNAVQATAADEKFEKYLFNPDNKEGAAKGAAFSSRLGYSADNWKDLQREILKQSQLNPASHKRTNRFGDLYEQKMILYGKKGKPANVVVGWIKEGNSTRLTSAYIKEVQPNEIVD